MLHTPEEARLKDVIRRVVETASPEKIILFGSAARGEMGPDSDLDLLVVVSATKHRRRTAQAIYRNLVGVGVSVDVVVVTEEDVRLYGQEPGMVIQPALQEGKILYAA